jgi:ATP synthase protein I
VDTGYLAEARRSAFRVVGWQCLAALLAGAVGLLAGGVLAGEAALIGGLIATAAQLVVTLRVFGGTVERDPRRFLARLILGEALKFAVTIAMFIVALVILKTAFLPLILGYLAGFAAYWFGYMRSSFGRNR